MSSNENQSPTILAVDDSPVMQDLVKRALSSEYRVLVADNAVDALSIIYHDQIALLLLDVTMPGIDGLELCRTVRNIPQFQELPIIMLTARDGMFDKVQGRLAGATEYLTKPFQSEQLCQVVKTFLSIHANSEETVEQRSKIK
ncbi:MULTISPECIES: response regulator [Planktothricoides]|uniref:Response regulator n=2 Tax=Planktothricoides raciborskii TaxID=132608 RepID=A0AAU8JE47_9CYAN|nr:MULTISPECIES: response regulator [Planktothricoides]KOR37298.1 regulator [Planktothricoides sp. SR001]MBD2542352.1 response regulator [Planktothricoides raciborskii FACHB-1370]MBD2582020.1 response regulator [Planktothricoides raciborskii FACHB-1261]